MDLVSEDVLAVQAMARNFALITYRGQLTKLLEKYGRERLLREFEPHLRELSRLNYFPRATQALKLLRAEISFDDYFET